MVDCSVGESSLSGSEPTTLFEDWVTIWQSEMAGLVLDRELHEALLRWVDGWAAQARLILAMAPQFDATTGTVPPPRPTTPAPAPDDRGTERDHGVAQLHQRIAELERRLASLEPPVP